MRSKLTAGMPQSMASTARRSTVRRPSSSAVNGGAVAVVGMTSRLHVVPDHAAEAQVAGGRVDGLRHARGRAITLAVVRRAQIRAAFHDLARDADLRHARVEAVLGGAAARVLERAAGPLDSVVVLVPVRGPFPHV